MCVCTHVCTRVHLRREEIERVKIMRGERDVKAKPKVFEGLNDVEMQFGWIIVLICFKG